MAVVAILSILYFIHERTELHFERALKHVSDHLRLFSFTIALCCVSTTLKGVKDYILASKYKKRIA